MKNILIVCGGKHQIPIVKKAKSLGYQVINTNLYEDSPAFPYADFTEVIDVLDFDKNYLCGKRYKVDGVVAEQNELSIYTVAYVSEKLGLPTITTELAKLFTDKSRMRRFCEKNGFPFPKFKSCYNLEQALEFVDANSGKLIMKPLDSFSSRGVFEINSIEECQKYYSQTSSFSSDNRSVIIEEYIEGEEFTVDGIVINGKHYTLAISQKSHYEHNKNIACKLYFSYENENFDYNVLRKEHNRLIEKTGLSLGLTHSEYKYHKGQFYLIEMAARGGGNYIASEIVPQISGIDNYMLYLKSSVKDELPEGEEISKVIQENSFKHVSMEFLDICTKGKRIKEIRGVKEIRSLQGIMHFELNFQEGDIVKKAEDDSTRSGFFIAAGESKEEIEKITKMVYDILEIEVEE